MIIDENQLSSAHNILNTTILEIKTWLWKKLVTLSQKMKQYKQKPKYLKEIALDHRFYFVT